jgi:pimeloyl-ACP methyl ester carboxylesterase
MSRANNNGIEIEYDTIGDPKDEPLLLVMGFTAQLIAWDEKFCRAIADEGFFVIRYDNRDCGLSSHLDGVQVDVAALLNARNGFGEPPPVPYKLSEMASDGIAVLDALDIERAHAVGASMGGMIVQTLAIEFAHRLRTVTSIMSTTGEPDVGQAAPEAMAALMRPPASEREEAIAGSVAASKLFSSPRYFDEEKARARAAAAYDRAFYPEGAMRQMAAIGASGSRAERLPEVRLPMLVIHGRADTLIDVSGGLRTAELVPGANLLVLNDMGHDLPEPLWPVIVDAITSHASHAIG